MELIKHLLKRYLTERILLEADPQGHFKDRVLERVYGIKSIIIPHNFYKPNTPRDQQNDYIIRQIETSILGKIRAVTNKTYPDKGGAQKGICVLVPLGNIIVRTDKGNTSKVIIKAEGNSVGSSYYITIYDNRMPTIVLADDRIPANSSSSGKLEAHLNNTERNGWTVNRKESFIDNSFNDPIIINV